MTKRNPYGDRKPQVQAIDIAGRVPPNNTDAEEAVLSAVLLDGARAIDAVVEILPSGEPFYVDAHRRIYDTALELHVAGQPVDIQTVANVLKDRDRLNAIGGVSYLCKIVGATPSVANIAAHAQIVANKWMVRRVIEASQMTAAEGYGDYGTAEMFVEAAEQRIYEIAHSQKGAVSSVLLYDALKSMMTTLDEAASRGDAITGVPTGFTDLDEQTSGMHAGELIILAARPGMGKTGFATDIAINVARPLTEKEEKVEQRTRWGVAVFSLEMPTEQLAIRMACSDSRTNLAALRKNRVSGDKWDRFTASVNELSGYPIWIDDRPGITVMQVRAAVRRIQAEYDKKYPGSDKWKQKIGLIIIDYLQLMGASESSTSGRNREQEVADISRGLKALAKDMGVPVLALAQLSRAVETRGGKSKRPQLSDLRESGSIEQDADVIQFIYRPEYYLTQAGESVPDQLRGYAEVGVAKQRNGPPGIVPVTFLADCVRFENRDRAAWREAADA